MRYNTRFIFSSSLTKCLLHNRPKLSAKANQDEHSKRHASAETPHATVQPNVQKPPNSFTSSLQSECKNQSSDQSQSAACSSGDGCPCGNGRATRRWGACGWRRCPGRGQSVGDCDVRAWIWDGNTCAGGRRKNSHSRRRHRGSTCGSVGWAGRELDRSRSWIPSRGPRRASAQVEWLRVLLQGRVLFVLDDKSVGIKLVLCWRPCVFSIQIVDASFDDWALIKSDVSLALKQGD